MIATHPQVRPDRWFYAAFGLALAAVVFVGFAPSFYLKSMIHAPPPLSALTVVHGVVFTAWVGLFAVQAALIGAGRTGLHRQLGMLGALLFGAMIVLGLDTALTAGRLGHAPPGAPTPLAFMALPLSFILFAALLVGAALWLRTKPDTHKRLMLAAMISMTPPATSRFVLGALGMPAQSTWAGFLLMNLMLAIAIGYDAMRRGRVHPAYVWSAGVFAGAELFVLWAFSSPLWLAFAAGLVRT